MKLYPRFLVKIILPIAEKLLSIPFTSVLREWKKLEKLDSETIQSYQQNKLSFLLNHATNTVPGYRSLRSDLLLSDFPIATKEMYRNREEIWISSLFNSKNLIVEKSSGSSGIQGKVYMTKMESMRSLAHQTYLWSWSGYEPGQRLLQLGITPNRGILKTIKDFFFRVTYKQAFNLDPTDVLKTLKYVERKSSSMIFGGYASGLYEYSNLAKRYGIKNVKFKSIISWGDKMFDHYRTSIEAQFDTKVYDTYGCTEGLMIAGQCEYQSYHILSPHVYIEILDDDDNPVPDGKMGHVVITRLDAFAMPLIRYKLGDLAIKAACTESCQCGRPFPMLKKIIGRDTDLVKTPTGKTLIVHFFTGVLEHITEIEQFQVVQYTTQEFEIRYLTKQPSEVIKNLLLKLHNELEVKAAESLNIRFTQVDIIPPSPSGKPQIIVSHISKL